MRGTANPLQHLPRCPPLVADLSNSANQSVRCLEICDPLHIAKTGKLLKYGIRYKDVDVQIPKSRRQLALGDAFNIEPRTHLAAASPLTAEHWISGRKKNLK